MRDYKRGECVTEVSYELMFWNYDDGGGFAFPCDKDGNLLSMDNPGAVNNYKWCLEHPEKFDVNGHVKKETHSWREPNSGVCNCGNRIELFNEYMGACECPHCGQWWNLFGQELKNPDRWSDGEDW